jgi:hypothetical protein
VKGVASLVLRWGREARGATEECHARAIGGVGGTVRKGGEGRARAVCFVADGIGRRGGPVMATWWEWGEGGDPASSHGGGGPRAGYQDPPTTGTAARLRRVRDGGGWRDGDMWAPRP